MQCTECKQDKDISEFYKRNTKKGFMSACKSCHQSRMTKKHIETKLFLVERFGGRCMECGYVKQPRILQFHHRDPSMKEFGISDRGRYNLEGLIEECEKCDLLCPNCHAEKHLTHPV